MKPLAVEFTYRRSSSSVNVFRWRYTESRPEAKWSLVLPFVSGILIPIYLDTFSSAMGNIGRTLQKARRNLRGSKVRVLNMKLTRNVFDRIDVIRPQDEHGIRITAQSRTGLPAAELM